MAEHTHLLGHLLNPKSWDRRDPILVSRNAHRLYFNYLGQPGGWLDVADFIAGPMRGAAWFPDANLAFLEPAEPVWNALRLTALSSLEGSTVVTSIVEHEMAEWLKAPYHNKKRAADIRAAIDGETWIRTFRMVPSHRLYPALCGYTQLLGFQRTLARPVRNGLTLVGTAATDKCLTMNMIRDRIGPRATGLAKKGRIDDEKCGLINISDEMHCVMVISYALLNRRPSVILTADSDYLEVFYKAQWFIDTHYRAWLAAKLIKAGQYSVPAKELHDTHGIFDGPLTLYRRYTSQLQEVLPSTAQAVEVILIYVAPDDTVHLMSFPFELPMLEMLETRSKTDGRCTELFGDANIHVDLGPLKRKLDGLYLGIGRDVVKRFEANGVRSSVAMLDLRNSIACCERWSPQRMEGVNGRGGKGPTAVE